MMQYGTNQRSEIARMVVESTTIRRTDAKSLEVQILLYLEVRTSWGWVAAKLGLEQRECQLNRVQVRRVGGQILKPYSSEEQAVKVKLK